MVYKTSGLVSVLVAAFGIAMTITAGGISISTPPNTAHAAGLANEFGIVGAVPSSPSDSDKQALVDKIADLSMGWNRHEFHYADPVDFSTYDAAHAKLQAKGIKTLGLLAYPGNDKTHDQWKAFVNSVVGHYGSAMSAWEIMNEADVYLSPSDYVVYLREAKDIIKGINPQATIVLSGITSRPETPNFWSGVAAAGGWGDFDVAGLHVYHSGNPEKVNFGGGDLLAEFDRAVSALSSSGGGKKIWITETGYRFSDGDQNQGNWLARTLVMARSVSSIEKVFIYRLADDTWGLATGGLANRPSYAVVKETVANLAGRGIAARLYPSLNQTLDSFDAVSGWTTKTSQNAAFTVSGAVGKVGAAMKLDYSFTASSAYGVAEKNIAITGTPQALAAWFLGDGSSNVWKFRFKDKFGETFQTDLGAIGANWQYKQFTIGQDGAIVSWGGNGAIDFPISFHAVVIDRQGGPATGSGLIDELVAITGGSDLWAFDFGDTVAYWKTFGATSAALCGANRQFNETPAYVSGVNCADTSSAKPSPSPKKSAASRAVASKDTSTVRVDGEGIVADATATYRIVVVLKDGLGKVITSIQPSVTSEDAAVVIGQPTLVGPEWFILVSASTAGDKVVKIIAGATEIKSVTLTFLPVTTPTPAPVLLPIENRSAGNVSAAQRIAAVWTGLALIAGLATVVYKKMGWPIYGFGLFARRRGPNNWVNGPRDSTGLRRNRESRRV